MMSLAFAVLRSRFLAAFRWMTANSTHSLLVLLGIALVFSAYERNQAAKWRMVARERAQDIVDMRDASDANLAAQIAQSRAVEEKAAALAKDSQTHETEMRNQLAAAGDAYARANSLRARTTHCGAPGASREDQPPSGGDGSGADAVVLDRQDYDVLVGNTARLKAVNDWGKSLIDAGLATDGASPKP